MCVIIPISCIAPIVAPGPVSRLQNDSITDVCVTLSWSFGFNGNAPITGVYITYTATSNYGSTQGGDQTGATSTNTKDTTSITVCNLQPLTTYEFNVSVENTVSNTVGRSSVETILVTTLSSGMIAVCVQTWHVHCKYYCTVCSVYYCLLLLLVYHCNTTHYIYTRNSSINKNTMCVLLSCSS